MILKREIEQAAIKQSVAKSTIDKDWVLGHFIDAIFSVKECRESFVFKGGTCLRKCYFPDYRFSEDLDFTSINKDFILDRKLLTKIARLVTERTETPLYIQELMPLLHKDQQMGFAAFVKFWGADHIKNQAPPEPLRWQTGIKIEITLFEKMIFPVASKSVSHPYSDKLTTAANDIPCYDLYEVISEKLRALIQRSYTAPRDYYDIWHLKNNLGSIDWQIIVKSFHEKMRFKNIEFTGIEQLINPQSEKHLQAAWNNSLAHQIKPGQLPTYEIVRNELLQLFGELF
jgi:predicted nucleotidyltransferase component of viral defense system